MNEQVIEEGEQFVNDINVFFMLTSAKNKIG